MDLSPVSRTAILTLLARVVASERDHATFADPMAGRCWEGLLAAASPAEKRWMIDRRRFYSGLSVHDALAGARRAKIFDSLADQYIAAHPGCSVINLACGFDTRYWRIARAHCRYMELDLPEVVAVKREILGDQLDYELIGRSVLDPAWVEYITGRTRQQVLLLAEGLLMFLPQPDVVQLFHRLTTNFVQSRFVFDMIPAKYLHGLWKILLRWETKINWQLEAAWRSGIGDPGEVETYGSGLRVVGVEKGSAGPVITVAIHES